MQIKILERPNEFPITLEEAKEHLRVLTNDEDDLIQSYIEAATEYCESEENRHYLTTKIKLILDEIDMPIRLPRPPFQDLEKIEFQKQDGTLEEWQSENYIVDDSGNFGFVRMTDSATIPSDLSENQKIQITYTAGHESADDVRRKVKAAIKLLTSHYWTQRSPISTTGGIPQEIGLTVSALLSKDRVVPV